MSYSRWINSIWYTYHDTNSGSTLDAQVFTICNVASFTYKELKADKEHCVDKCCESILRPNGEEREELKGYIQRFMIDVEAEYALERIFK